MVENLVSFGIVMLVETIITLVFIGDLIYMTQKKRRKLNHPHVVWDKGTIFAAYLYAVFIAHLTDVYILTMFYIVHQEETSMAMVTARVVGKTFFMLAKFLLWRYHKAMKPTEQLDIFNIKI